MEVTSQGGWASEWRNHNLEFLMKFRSLCLTRHSS